MVLICTFLFFSYQISIYRASALGSPILGFSHSLLHLITILLFVPFQINDLQVILDSSYFLTTHMQTISKSYLLVLLSKYVQI